MERGPSALLHWNWVPHTWVDVVQDVAWVLLFATLVPLAREAASALETRELRRRALLIAVAALLARLVVPLLPFNWHSGVMNVDLGGPIYSKDTTYMPLPNQLVTFTLGFYGILAFNIVTCTVSAVLAWHVSRRAGYGERIALLLGLGIALTPMYVRLSSSDATHMVALPLWWLAAVTMRRLVLGIGGRLDQIVLFTSAVVACPVRIEAGLVMPSVALFVARDLAGLRRVMETWRRWWPLLVGLIVGMLCNLAFHGSGWQYRLGQFNIFFFVVQLIFRALFLISPDPFGWIPIFYVLLIWYYLRWQLRRRDYCEVAATVGPFLLFSIPFVYSATAIAGELPSTAYGITIDMFVLLAAAKGASLLYDHVRDGTFAVRPTWRTPALVGAALILVASFAIPYRRTYAYMEEFAFLSRSLPRERVKILAIWDPTCPGGDYDCCLALPYPTFVGDFPNLEWHILGQDDVDQTRLTNLDFDYYYPGSLVAVDVENVDSWLFGRLLADPEENAMQKATLLRLQAIDQFVRNHYALESYRQESMPAHTFSGAPFRDDRMTLTLYRRVTDR